MARIACMTLLVFECGTQVFAETMSWPAPPARARIRYVGRYDTSPVTESRGFFAKMFDFIFGGVDQDIPRLSQPSAVAWSTTGDLYVTDLGRTEVYRVPADGTPWMSVSKKIKLSFSAPVGAAIVGDTLYVVDADARRITMTTSDGTLVRSFPTTGLQRPVALTADASYLYVTDALGCSVHVFDRAGHDVRSFGGRGDSAGTLNTPTNIARSGDTLFIIDALNFRVVAMTVDGKFVRSFGLAGDGPGAFARPRGIAVDADGHVYVVDAIQDCINIYGSTGEFLMTFGITGSAGPGQFQLPAGIAISRAGMIAVADAHNHCVQLFQYIP